jgi:hypothetical protein
MTRQRSIERALARRDTRLDRHVWPDATGCSAGWLALLADPPRGACIHQAAAVLAGGRSGPWFVLASDPAVRRCAACVPAELAPAAVLDVAGPPVRCDCCDRVSERAAVSALRGGLGTVLAQLCVGCYAAAQRGPLAGRAS